MSHKRAVLRARADRDIEESIDFYLRESAPPAALKFIDSLQQALGDAERHPAIGSTRYATELDLPGLRFWQIKGYPHLVFYMECEYYIDVWRVLHARRDIPVCLQPAE